MEFSGDFAFLSKHRCHINIDLDNISIEIIDPKEEYYEEIKQSFDKLKLMDKSLNFQINFKNITITNKRLSKDIYSGRFESRLSLKSNS